MKSPSELSLTSGELAAMLNKILRTSEIGAQVLEIRLFRERTFEDPTPDKELKSEIVPIKSGTDIHPGSRLFPNWSQGNSKAVTSFLIYMIGGAASTLIIVSPEALRHALVGGMAWRALLRTKE
jgi:hypothetical protein